MRMMHCLHGALVALTTVAPCGAAGLQFPSIPSSPGLAAATFSERAAAVITFNACSRETEYLDFRVQMRGDGSPFSGDYSNEGENLTNMLLAKVMWVRSHRHDDVCKGLMLRPRERNEDKTFKQATLGQFAAVDRAARAAEPLLCGKETGESAIEDAILVNVELTQSCMIRQINDSIMAMRKVGQMGSSDLVCVESLDFGSTGEWDVNVRELVRLLYASWPNPPSQGGVSLLDDETVDHMYRPLLAARGAPSDDDYSILGDCSEPAGDELGTPEDTADRHAWYRELFSGIGDIFEWLKSFSIKLAGSGLSSAAGLVAAPFLIAAGEDPFPAIFPHWDVRVAETENHRLMIETSRFLTNAEIIRTLEAEDYDHVEEVKDDQIEVRDWLLHRLQQIAAQDFDEYNARPYTRYSLEALLNLHDFTSRQADAALQTAARIVLDLSAAKFAAVKQSLVASLDSLHSDQQFQIVLWDSGGTEGGTACVLPNSILTPASAEAFAETVADLSGMIVTESTTAPAAAAISQPDFSANGWSPKQDFSDNAGPPGQTFRPTVNLTLTSLTVKGFANKSESVGQGP